MKQWVEEKRAVYLSSIIQGKGCYSRVCHGCSVGRPVWRCEDCLDNRPVCVLCCRNFHRNHPFHRIEKWNGRYFQRGALWQVGVKIYIGHNGNPCPTIGANEPGSSNQPCKFQQAGSKLEEPNASHSSLQSEIDMAEIEAGMLQADADRAAAEAETEAGYSSKSECTGDAQPIFADNGTDDEWEDEADSPPNGHIPRFLPRPPPRDGAGREFLTIVHSNGFHDLPVVWCSCPGRTEDRDLQLLKLNLYPASYDRIKTVFTFKCLDEQRIHSLESKSSLGQYHQQLRRLTCPEYPDCSPNRYAELRRVTRQWRNLKYRKWFWILDRNEPKRGEMALFCAACPQDGINLQTDWEEDYKLNP